MRIERSPNNNAADTRHYSQENTAWPIMVTISAIRQDMKEVTSVDFHYYLGKGERSSYNEALMLCLCPAGCFVPGSNLAIF